MENHFLPDSLQEWVTLVVMLGGTIFSILALVWRIIQQPLSSQINGLGSRVDSTDTTATRNAQDILNLQREYERQVFQHTAQAERIAKIEAAFYRMEDLMLSIKDKGKDEDSVVRERLGKIEVKLDTILPVAEMIKSLMHQARQQQQRGG